MQAEKLKKEREAQAKKNQVSAQDYVPAQQSSNQASCNRSASVTLPEDDYHRIKGLLGQWPHAASRTVERREGNAKKTVKYSVAVPIQVDAQAQLSELSAKGFSGTLSGGSIVVGSITTVPPRRIRWVGYKLLVLVLNCANSLPAAAKRSVYRKCGWYSAA